MCRSDLDPKSLEVIPAKVFQPGDVSDRAEESVLRSSKRLEGATCTKPNTSQGPKLDLPFLRWPGGEIFQGKFDLVTRPGCFCNDWQA